jgi:hypothetical protein
MPRFVTAKAPQRPVGFRVAAFLSCLVTFKAPLATRSETLVAPLVDGAEARRTAWRFQDER